MKVLFGLNTVIFESKKNINYTHCHPFIYFQTSNGYSERNMTEPS